RMSGTAEIYDAVLTPGKMDLLRAWVAGQPWFDGDEAALEQVTTYRFVDPDGAVGMESFLLTDGTRTFHVPVTYRAIRSRQLLAAIGHGHVERARGGSGLP